MLEASVGGAVAPEKEYAFEGDVIRLLKKDYKRWRELFPAIDDLIGTIATIDAYYACNPCKNGWWFAAQVWLKKENDKARSQKKKAEYGVTWF